MCISIGTKCAFLVELFLCITITEAIYHDCPVRQSLLLPGRKCRKPCISDSDCRSRKKVCLCDMNCGMSCIKKKHKCPLLPDIPNGRVIHPRELGFGASAKYECDDKYKLQGTQVRACQGDETWSGIEPRCVWDPTLPAVEKKGCTRPPLVSNAVHNGGTNRQSFPLQSVLLYTCLPGYTMDRDGVPRAFCVAKGGWVGPVMKCTKRKAEDISCPRLSDIANGYVEQADVVDIGGNATYRCKSGFHLAGRQIRRCGQNRRWEGAEPSCEKVTCAPPPVIESAAHNGNEDHFRFPTGAQLQYTCDHGFYGDGHPRAMCTEGRWIGLTLVCKPRGCGFPGDVINGRRSGYTFIYPHRVFYQCNEGYVMIGEDNRQCQANGEWSNDLPICKPVTCPLLYSPVYGRMIGSGNTFGTVVRFECDNDFMLVGSEERQCQRDQTWTGSNAKCQEVECALPTTFYNGFLMTTTTTVGSSLYFNCATRTKYHGKEFVVEAICRPDGTWSKSPPTCLGQCEIPTHNNATVLKRTKGEFVDHGTEVEYRCTNGMEPREASVIKCMNGTWTSTPECTPASCRNPPPHIRNGMRVYFGTNHMDRAKYRCFPGFRLDQKKMNTMYLTCIRGQWLGGIPQCEEFYCESPKQIENGAVYKKLDDVRFLFKPYIRSIYHGTRLEFKCDPGYRLVGPSGATCVNGDWRPNMDSPGTKCEEALHPPIRKLWIRIPYDER